ncbi:MAG: hypothetical protein IPL63_06040 [Saprospiraceae bacterium]|nr:hypothetical protein [Saprospiraceae bacterium]
MQHQGDICCPDKAPFQLSEAEADMAVVKRDFGMMMQFSNNRNVYPSTVIGIIAKFRELYKNSEILGSTNEEYNSNPVGINRSGFQKRRMGFISCNSEKTTFIFCGIFFQSGIQSYSITKRIRVQTDFNGCKKRMGNN